MKHYFKPLFFTISLFILTFGCQKDDTTIPEEDAQIKSLKAFNISKQDIPSHILGYVDQKTNNTFGVSIGKKA